MQHHTRQRHTPFLAVVARGLHEQRRENTETLVKYGVIGESRGTLQAEGRRFEPG